MKLSPSHLKRYKEIALLFWKYGRSDLVTQMDPDSGIEPEDLTPEGDEKATPEQLADDLEAMGPTYVKLGQVLSSRPDLLPEPYLKALARLQDKVKPFSYEEVEQIVTRELGVRISKAFSRFDRNRLAAASLGQVHAAALRDGRPVVVKVQRPGIAGADRRGFRGARADRGISSTPTPMRPAVPLRDACSRSSASPSSRSSTTSARRRTCVTVGKNLAEFELILVPQPVARLQHAPRAHDGLRAAAARSRRSDRWRASRWTARRSPRSCSARTSSRCWSTACSTPIRTRAMSSSPTIGASRCSTSAWSATPRPPCRRTC